MLLVSRFLLAFVASLVLVSVARKLALKFGFAAQPKAERWHSRPTALLGGAPPEVDGASGVASGTPVVAEGWALELGGIQVPPLQIQPAPGCALGQFPAPPLDDPPVAPVAVVDVPTMTQAPF